MLVSGGGWGRGGSTHHGRRQADDVRPLVFREEVVQHVRARPSADLLHPACRVQAAFMLSLLKTRWRWSGLYFREMELKLKHLNKVVEVVNARLLADLLHPA